MCENSYREYLIHDCFPERIFKAIVDYLKSEGLATIGDYMDLAELVELNGIQGVGEIKVKKFKSRLGDILSNNYVLDTCDKLDDYSSTASFKVNNVHRNTSISVLNKRIVKSLENIGVIHLTDLSKFSECVVVDTIGNTWNVGDKLRKEIIKEIELLSLDFEGYLKIKFDDFKKSSSNYPILKMRLEGKKLAHVGEKFNLTKERVRQKQNYALDELAPIFKGLITYYKDKGIIGKYKRIHETDLYANIDNREIIEIFMYFINNGMVENLHYSKNLDLIMYNRALSVTEDAILNKFKEYGDVFKFDSLKNEIDSDLDYLGLDFLTYDDVKLFLLNNGYNDYNGYFSKGRLSYEKMVSFVIRKYYKNGFSISNDYKDIYALVEAEFGVLDLVECDTQRRLESYVYELDDIVLKSNKTKIHIDDVGVTDTIVLKIKDKLSELLSEPDTLYVNIEKVFKEIVDEEPDFRKVIDNHYLLYGVSKYYLSNDFNFRRFYVSTGDSTGKLDSKIYKLIKEKGRKLSVNEIIGYFGLTEFRLKLLMILTDKVIYCDNRCYIDCVDNYSKHTKELGVLNNAIRYNIDKFKYCNISMVYRDNYKVVKSIGISDKDTLYNVLRGLFKDDFKFARKPHIISNDSNTYDCIFLNILDAVPRDVVKSKEDTNEFLKNVFYLPNQSRFKVLDLYDTYRNNNLKGYRS